MQTGSRNKKIAGFTLIELLIALVIFAVISALGYRSLSALIQTKQRVSAENDRWREVMLFFNRLDMDLQKHVNRPVRVGKTLLPAWVGKISLNGVDDAQIIFSRLGAAEQHGLQMDTQRIGYRYYAGNVELLVWPALDIETNQRPGVYTVLTGVRSMTVKYMEHTSRTWVTTWPVVNQTDIVPKAVSIEIVLKSGEKLSRLFYLQ